MGDLTFFLGGGEGFERIGQCKNFFARLTNFPIEKWSMILSNNKSNNNNNSNNNNIYFTSYFTVTITIVS